MSLTKVIDSVHGIMCSSLVRFNPCTLDAKSFILDLNYCSFIAHNGSVDNYVL